jgi:hypothetical protein
MIPSSLRSFKLLFSRAILTAAVLAPLVPADSPVPPLAEEGFKPIFDGKTMSGWDCDPSFWRVAEGAIIGESTLEHQPVQNTFCIWKGGEPADFEFKAEYRLTGVNDGNSGIQYRSVELPEVAKWVLKGYQADIDLKQRYTGQIYEERNRGFLALRGQIANVPDGKKSGSIGTLGSDADLRNFIKDANWNEIHIIARGNTLVQLINGHVMSIVVDDDTANRKMRGELGIQLHRLPGAAMKMETRSIRLKTF